MVAVVVGELGGQVQVPELPCEVSYRKSDEVGVEFDVDSPPSTTNSSDAVPWMTLFITCPLSGIGRLVTLVKRGLEVGQGRLRSRASTSSRIEVWLRLF